MRGAIEFIEQLKMLQEFCDKQTMCSACGMCELSHDSGEPCIDDMLEIIKQEPPYEALRMLNRLAVQVESLKEDKE